VRELQSVVKQALLGSTGPVILPEFLPPVVRGQGGELATGEAAFDFGGLTAYVQDQLRAESTSLYGDYQRLTDRHLLAIVLSHAGGNLTRASRALGITRATLRAKLATLGMTVERAAPADEAAG
jgi:two-component system nitrogen regulation response regulator GlnG